MSAIAGAISFDPSRFVASEHHLAAMLETMRHRGPAGSGKWIESSGRASIGQRRRIASTADRQPVGFRNETLWLAMDGSIFNREELREALERAGHNGLSENACDAELAVRAFDAWGIDCLERFNGTFAIAIWDGREKALWLARDRIGVKPIYYSAHNGRLTFASEIKALLADPDQARAVCEEAFYHYLSFNLTPAPRTMFEGIKKLAGGVCLSVGADGSIREHRYWDVCDHTSPIIGVPDDELLDMILEDLERCTALQSTAHGQVGMFLSSGLDSNLGAALLAKHVPAPLQTFTYDFQVDYTPYRHEADAVRKAVQAHGYENHVYSLSQEEYRRSLPHAVYFADEPISDPIFVAYLHLAKMAQGLGISTTQHALGSDELFIGKPDMMRLIKLQDLNGLPVPNFAKWLGLFALRLAGRAESFPYDRLRRATRGEPVIWSANEMFNDAHKMRVISPRLRQRFADFYSFEAVEATRKRFEEKAWEKSSLHWMTYSSLHILTPEHQMMRSDKMGMSAAHEIRAPMLDHKFVELALSLPAEVHLRKGRTKRIVEDIAAKINADAYVERSYANIGFPYPWLFGELAEFARSELDVFCRETDFLDRAEVLNLIDSCRETKNIHSARQMWCLLTFATWWNGFIGQPAGANRQSLAASA
jgi:asparagine synthase (glutamine-hydrolysing)